MNENERQWAEAMRAERKGDAYAYEWLLKDVTRALRRVVNYRLRQVGLNESETEDIVQEVLIGVHNKRHTWNESRPFVPWLASITRYKVTDAMRRQGRERARQMNIEIEELIDSLATPMDKASSMEDVERHVSSLPQQQQDVVRALSLQGKSVRETAQDLGRSEASIRVTFNRALRRLFKRSDSE